MFVLKRNKQFEKVDVYKIIKRLENLSGNITTKFDYKYLALKTANCLIPNITTEKIDFILSEICASKIIDHYEYNQLAANIIISNLHKNTSVSFKEVTQLLYKNEIVNQNYWEVVNRNFLEIEKLLNYNLDYNFDYFGIDTLKKKYLLKVDNVIIERPQHLFMRVAVALHNNDLKAVAETYYYLSNGYFIHSSPTLFSAGMVNQQMSSCFVLQIKEDSINGIFDTIKECACISKNGGGIGLYVGNVRANGSYIKGTNGYSNGIVPMLKVINNVSLYVDQGGNKRPGSIAVYLDPWHADILDFLKLKTQVGHENLRARDLFYGLMIPDLFMHRAKNNLKWSLMCPNDCPDLCDSFGEKFEELYLGYEKSGLKNKENKEGKVIKVLEAKALFQEILRSQMETGMPYIIFKDSANKKSNHQHLGTIKASNLCTEILEYFSPEETSVCNLASVALNKFYSKKHDKFDFNLFGKIVQIIVKNLNICIDFNDYPSLNSKISNFKHRPIGLGVQGMADLFFMKKIAFDSEDAGILNEQIFECMYYNAMVASNELSKIHGPYESYKGSPISKGLFQFDLWNKKIDDSNYNWSKLRRNIALYGVRNSLLIAPMPTAGTSQIMGNYECFEPVTNNVFTRSTITGQYQIVNKYMMSDLINLGLWNKNMKNKIIANKGSIQTITEIPADVRKIYRNVWEYKQKTLIDLAIKRGPFIDQSQSLSIYMNDPSYSKLYTMFMYSWEKGLKTGLYYLRGKGAANAIQFTVTGEENNENKEKIEICNINDKDCLSCQG